MNTVRGHTSLGLLDLGLGRWLDEETGASPLTHDANRALGGPSARWEDALTLGDIGRLGVLDLGLPRPAALVGQDAARLHCVGRPWGGGSSRSALSAACRARYWSILSSISRGKGGTGPTSFRW